MVRSRNSSTRYSGMTMVSYSLIIVGLIFFIFGAMVYSGSLAFAGIKDNTGPKNDCQGPCSTYQQSVTLSTWTSIVSSTPVTSTTTSTTTTGIGNPTFPNSIWLMIFGAILSALGVVLKIGTH